MTLPSTSHSKVASASAEAQGTALGVLTQDEARLWARAGVLAAFALVLSYAETFIPLPLPVPGAKLGLANIAILVALKVTNARCAFAVALVKTLAAGLLFGSPIMIPYSAAGTLFAFIIMLALVRVPGLHLVMVSVCGSVGHVAGQLVVASLMLGTLLVWYTFPLLMVVACVTGILTGKIAAFLLESLRTSDEFSEQGDEEQHNEEQRDTRSGGDTKDTVNRKEHKRVDARVLLFVLLVYLVVVFCAQSAFALGVCTLVAGISALVANMSLRDALKALAPLASILVITLVAHIAYLQQGTVVVYVGPVAITQEALTTVAFIFTRLVCIMVTSAAFARMVSTDELASALTSVWGVLERCGVRTCGVALALDLALRFVPVLVEEFRSLKAEYEKANPALSSAGIRVKLRAYRTMLAPLTVRAFTYADREADRMVA